MTPHLFVPTLHKYLIIRVNIEFKISYLDVEVNLAPAAVAAGAVFNVPVQFCRARIL